MKPKFEEQQRNFLKRMAKPQSVERTVYFNLKPRHFWEEGLTIIQLREIVIKEKKKRYTAQRIYNAIGDINRFGKKWGLYIRSDYSWIDTKEGKKKEWRYFTPFNKEDVSDEFEKLDDRKFNAKLREESLEYHQKVTIPQEQKLAQIQR